jgi:PH domain/Calponin homology (CH) domain/N-terminal or F0 domain of Talin-head FERM
MKSIATRKKKRKKKNSFHFSFSTMGDAIVVRIRLQNKLFTKVEFDTQETVRKAREKVAKITNGSLHEFGLFKPPKDDEVGHWLRDDYPLEFYGLQGIGASAFTEYLEWRKIHRPIRVLQEGGTFTTVLADDTLKVSALTQCIGEAVGFENATPLDFIEEDENVEILFPEMTLREQGLIGELTVGLVSRGFGAADCGVYVQLPFWEGRLQRKGKGFMKKWVKRWYVLRKNKITFFKSRDDPHEIDSISLRSVARVCRCKGKDSSLPAKLRLAAFEVHYADETVEVFVADDADERAQWVLNIDLARRMYATETQFFGKHSNKVVDPRLKHDDDDDEGHGGAAPAGGSRQLSTRDFRHHTMISASPPAQATEPAADEKEELSTAELLARAEQDARDENAPNKAQEDARLKKEQEEEEEAARLKKEEDAARLKKEQEEAARLQEEEEEEEASSSSKHKKKKKSGLLRKSVSKDKHKIKPKKKKSGSSAKLSRPKKSSSKSSMAAAKAPPDAVAKQASAEKLPAKSTSSSSTTTAATTSAPVVTSDAATSAGAAKSTAASPPGSQIAASLRVGIADSMASALPNHMLGGKKRAGAHQRAAPALAEMRTDSFVFRPQSMQNANSAQPNRAAELFKKRRLNGEARQAIDSINRIVGTSWSYDADAGYDFSAPIMPEFAVVSAPIDISQFAGDDASATPATRAGQLARCLGLAPPPSASSMPPVLCADEVGQQQQQQQQVAPVEEAPAAKPPASATKSGNMRSKFSSAFASIGLDVASSDAVEVGREQEEAQHQQQEEPQRVEQQQKEEPKRVEEQREEEPKQQAKESSEAGRSFRRMLQRRSMLDMSAASPSSSSASSSSAAGISPVIKRRYLQLASSDDAQSMTASRRAIFLTNFINKSVGVNLRAKDAYLQHMLPLRPVELMACTSDGVLLAKVVNIYAKDTIDESLLSIPAHSVASYIRNLELVLAATQQKICAHVRLAVTPQDFMERKLDVIEDFMVTLADACMFVPLAPATCPGLLSLLGDGEPLYSIRRVPPADVLLRWLNVQLRRCDDVFSVDDLGEALADGRSLEAVARLLNGDDVLDVLDGLTSDSGNDNATSRCLRAIGLAKKLGARVFVDADALASGDECLNVAFLAALFDARAFPQREATLVERVDEARSADALCSYENASGESNAIRALRVWVNSLGLVESDGSAVALSADLIERVKSVDILYAIAGAISPWTFADGKEAAGSDDDVDASDGDDDNDDDDDDGAAAASSSPAQSPAATAQSRSAVAAAALLQSTARGVVSKSLAASTVFARIEQANRFVAMCAHTLKLRLPQISGSEVTSGVTGPIVALIHALRMYDMARYPRRVNGKKPSLVTVERWANARIAGVKLGVRKIRGFGDASLKSGIFMLFLAWTVAPELVNLSLVTPGQTPTQRRLNAQYLLSVLAKLSLPRGVIWEELVSAQQRAFAFLATQLYLFSLKK